MTRKEMYDTLENMSTRRDISPKERRMLLMCADFMRDWDKKWEMIASRERLATIGRGGSLIKVIEIATDALAHPRMRTDALTKIIKEASSNIGDTVKGYQIKDWDAFKAFKKSREVVK